MDVKNLKPGESVVVDLTKLSAEQERLLTGEQKRLRRLIERRHPEYKNSLSHWRFLEATYEGGRDWFDRNVFKFYKEGKDEFGDRVARAYRFNHTKEVVDLLNKYLFKQAIDRNDTAPESLRAFWKRATRKGLSMTELARQVSKLTSIGGRVGIVVDRPNTSALSVAEAKKVENQPYAYVVTQQQLLDYSFAEDGKLNWVLILECKRDDEDPMESGGDVKERYRLWTRSGWELYEERTEGRRKKVVLIDSGDHSLGEVPVILADHIIGDDDYEAPSLIDDIAYLDRAVANYLSNLDAIIQDQTFSQLAMPAQNLLPGEEAANKVMEMSTKRVFLYDGENGGKPEYLSPDPKQAELILAVINKIISEIYHTVGLAGERTKQDNAVGIDNSSGVAKAFDFERVNALLASKADALELVENQIARLVCLWNGEKYEEDLVSYADNFDTRDLYDEFDIASRLVLVEAPDAVRRVQMATLVDKLFPQLKADIRKEFEKELKDWPADPMEEAMKLAQAAGKAPTGSISASKGGDSAKPAAGSPKTPTRQGQVTKDTK
jgi:hypothetical protein